MDAAPAGKEVIRLNMDETSVSFFYGHGKGNMVVSSRPFRSRDVPVQHATKKALRGAMTHVAFLCDKQEFQKALATGNSVCRVVGDTG